MALEKEKLQKIIVIGACAILISALYYNLVIDRIQAKSIQELNTKINETQTRLEKGKENEKRWKQLCAPVTEGHPFLVAQEAKLMKGDRVAWLWSEMSGFAEKQKMSRVAVSPEAPAANALAENESYTAAGASLNLNCGYHKLGEFVQNLENTYPTIQVQHIEILGGAGPSPDTHTVRLQYQLLAMREEKTKESEKEPKVAQALKKKE